MRVGILCASDEELAPFLPMLKDRQERRTAKLTVHLGTLAGVETAALFSGVCKVNAAIGTQILLDTFQAEVLLLSGTAGGIDPELEILDTVLSTEAVYHDVAGAILTGFHPWLERPVFPADANLLALSRAAVDRIRPPGRVFWGRMATGEAFVDGQRRQRLQERLHPLCADMETAAAAHVCHAFGVPYLAIRTITDTARHGGEETFEKNVPAASALAASLTAAVVQALGITGEPAQKRSAETV